MKKIMEGLREHAFPLRVGIFLAMVLPSAGLYLAANRGGDWRMWLLIGVVILANILAMFQS